MKGTSVLVDCEYSRGMFDTEYAVLLSIVNGAKVSFFADKDLIVPNGKNSHGLLKATATSDVAAPVVSVLLPNETELGTRLVSVPKEYLRLAA